MNSNPATFDRLKTIHCKSCGEESLISSYFCGGCGKRLQEPCLDCGENHPVDVGYCEKCGTDTAAKMSAAQQTIAEAIGRADSQAETGRFIDAVETLRAVVVVDHSQLQELADQIDDRLEQFPICRERAIAESKQMAEEVHGLLEQRQYHLAHERLTSVLPAFLNQELRKLLEKVQPRVEESNHLRTIVKKMLQERNYANLLQHVERLAELNPDDGQVAALLAKLKKRSDHKNAQVSSKLIGVIESALKKSDYQSALAAIKKLPTPLENERVKKLVQAVKERVWLAEQLDTAPYISTTVLALAQRMNKLQPNDDHHLGLSKKLAHRWNQARNKDQTRPVPWKKSPQPTAFGLPVDFLPLPVELARTRKSDANSCQSMLVPFGLALQAIGEAKFNIHLLPRDKDASWLKRLARRKHQESAKTGWGIEIGTAKIKAIQLSRDPREGKIQVVQSFTRSLRDESTDQTIGHELAIKQLLRQCEVAGQPLVISLPGIQTFGRFFDIPAPKPRKFMEAVQYEMQARIPLKAEELVYDYHWSELPSAGKGVTPRRRVLLVAAKRKPIAERLRLFQEAEASQCVAQSDCLAICNSVLHTRKIPSDAGAIAIVEIGAETGNLVVLNQSDVWFRGLYLGTNSMDQTLVENLKIPRAKAELLRRQPHRAPCLHELHELLLPEFATLAATVRRALDQYQREVGQPISQLFLCGSGAEQYGLLRYLRLGD